MKQKSKSVFSKKIKLMKRKVFFLKVRAFLLFVLPVGIAAVAQAVIKEYSRIKVRELASLTKPGETLDSR